MKRPVWARCGGVFAGVTLIAGVVVEAAFPDAHNPPPAGWSGPVFKLSQNYPATLPNLEPTSQRKWTQFDFKNPMQAPQYLKAVLDYCLDGNTPNNFADVSQALKKSLNAVNTSKRNRRGRLWPHRRSESARRWHADRRTLIVGSYECGEKAPLRRSVRAAPRR